MIECVESVSHALDGGPCESFTPDNKHVIFSAREVIGVQSVRPYEMRKIAPTDERLPSTDLYLPASTMPPGFTWLETRVSDLFARLRRIPPAVVDER